MAEQKFCDMCSCPINPDERYVVRIQAYADPAVPAIDTSRDEPGHQPYPDMIQDIIRQLEHLSADELQDQVYREYEYSLCTACHRLFLSNPLGKPRRRSVGRN